MSGVGPKSLFFLGLPDLNQLVCITLSLQEEDHQEPRTNQMKTCRELVLLYSDILACPSLDSITDITAVMAIQFLQRGVLQAFALRNRLQLGRPQRVFPGDLQSCLSYSLISRLAPRWNKAGLYLIAGGHFLTQRGRLGAVGLELSTSEGRLCISVEANTVRLPPPTLEDFELPPLVLRRFWSDPESVLDPASTVGPIWCHVLPSMKKGQIITISRRLPADGPFRTYRDLQSHWNRLYGYRLPDLEEGEAVFCSVYFRPLGEKLFTYPLSCIRLQPVQRCPRVDLQGALACFLSDVRERLQSVCGFPARLTSKPSYCSVNLTTAASLQVQNGDQINLTTSISIKSGFSQPSYSSRPEATDWMPLSQPPSSRPEATEWMPLSQSSSSRPEATEWMPLSQPSSASFKTEPTDWMALSQSSSSRPEATEWMPLSQPSSSSFKPEATEWMPLSQQRGAHNSGNPRRRSQADWSSSSHPSSSQNPLQSDQSRSLCSFFQHFQPASCLPPHPRPSPVPVKPSPKLVPIFRNNDPSRRINVALLRAQKQNHRITLPVPLGSKPANPPAYSSSLSALSIPPAPLIAPRFSRRPRNQCGAVPPPSDPPRVNRISSLSPVSRVKPAIIVPSRIKLKTKTSEKVGNMDFAVSKYCKVTGPEGIAPKSIMKTNKEAGPEGNTEPEPSQPPLMAEGISNKKKKVAFELKEERLRKSKAAVQDVETMARSHQLSRLNSSTLLLWLRQRGVLVGSKLRKEELIVKVMSLLAEA